MLTGQSRPLVPPSSGSTEERGFSQLRRLVSILFSSGRLPRKGARPTLLINDSHEPLNYTAPGASLNTVRHRLLIISSCSLASYPDYELVKAGTVSYDSICLPGTYPLSLSKLMTSQT